MSLSRPAGLHIWLMEGMGKVTRACGAPAFERLIFFFEVLKVCSRETVLLLEVVAE
jgi:hypothetical protein